MRAKLFVFRNEYFLFLLPLYFIVHGYAENFGSVTIKEAAILLLEYIVVITLFSILAAFLFRSWRKSAVFTLLWSFIYFYFGVFHDEEKRLFGSSFPTHYTFLLPLLLVLFIISILFFKRTKRDFPRLVRYANLLFIVLLVFETAQFWIQQSKRSTAENSLAAAPVSICDTCTKPDIYLIVADEYAGNKELKDVLHFDNKDFENALQQRGFHIVQNSKSNYNYTPFSMASMLNMEFLTGIEGRNSSKHDRIIWYQKINNSTVARFLKAQGYQIINYSIFNFAHLDTKAEGSFIKKGVDLLTAQTLMGRIDRDIRFNLVTRFHITSEVKRIVFIDSRNNELLYAATKKESEKPTSQPRFIYTHLVMPHYPYYVNKFGQPNAIDILTEGNQYRQKEYVEYLEYCNKQFLQLIDYILQHAKKPPVILFMGDHGFRHFITPVDSAYHFMNLNAIYLPNKNTAGFYDGMSNINQFRILFNAQFNARLPVLKDSTSFLSE